MKLSWCVYRLPGLSNTCIHSVLHIECCLCVGAVGLAAVTHRKQDLALSCTLNTQEIHTGSHVSTACALLVHSSIFHSSCADPREGLDANAPLYAQLCGQSHSNTPLGFTSSFSPDLFVFEFLLNKNRSVKTVSSFCGRSSKITLYWNVPHIVGTFALLWLFFSCWKTVSFIFILPPLLWQTTNTLPRFLRWWRLNHQVTCETVQRWRGSVDATMVISGLHCWAHCTYLRQDDAMPGQRERTKLEPLKKLPWGVCFACPYLLLAKLRQSLSPGDHEDCICLFLINQCHVWLCCRGQALLSAISASLWCQKPKAPKNTLLQPGISCFQFPFTDLGFSWNV